MCGIAGIFDISGQRVNLDDLETLKKSLNHRGPDDCGTWCKNNVGLAHTRLSIIDVTSKAHQPMSNEDGTIWITFNGEIYNFLELRKKLEHQGHTFKSDSDTEVIIHLYEEKGTSCFEDLRGMFAFAIWDENKQQLLIAKDRIGKKPLFYTFQNNKLIFASELKAIASLPWFNKQIDMASLAHVFSYDHVPWPNSIYKHIHKLPPSSYILFDSKQRKQGEINKYWNPDLQTKIKISENDAVDRLTELLREAVQLRLRSDVPLGMFLSGGLDSSFVVGLASQCVDQPIQTFTIGYEDSETEDLEYPFSDEVSACFNTVHHKVPFDKGTINSLPDLMYHYDEPFCIPNALAHYQLCKETRKHVTVSLSGDGADEIFAGYDVYKKWKLLDLATIFMPMKNATRCNFPLDTRGFSKCIPLKLLFTPRAFRRGMEKHLSYQQQAAKIFSQDAWDEMKQVNIGGMLADLYLERKPKEFLDGVLYGDLLLNYSWSTTIASDISGMANSLEVRSPFLDHKVVEFAFSLPTNLKLKWFNKEKYILYKAGQSFLPEAVINRKKMSYGAGFPYKKWFFNEWMPFIKQIIFDDKVMRHNYFNMTYVEKLLANPDCDSSCFKQLWRILCTSAWLHSQS